jgi:hypothetical protein
MRFIGKGRTRLVVGAVAVMLAAGVGISVAATSSSTPSNSIGHGMGQNEFGLTKTFLKGKTTQITYTKGYYCDTSVKSAASSKCEAGADFKKAPNKKDFDPLYIMVPLGFHVPAMKMECPSGLICVDHPGTIDLSRLEPALKPLYPNLSDAQLTAALKNFQTPGHQHFITTRAGGKKEWWDVKVVGVTNRAEYDKITHHASARFLLKEAKAGRAVGPIDTNLFLFFAAK